MALDRMTQLIPTNLNDRNTWKRPVFFSHTKHDLVGHFIYGIRKIVESGFFKDALPISVTNAITLGASILLTHLIRLSSFMSFVLTRSVASTDSLHASYVTVPWYFL